MCWFLQVGKAFAVATVVVFGGATLMFGLAVSKLQVHNVSMDLACLLIRKFSPLRRFLSCCELVILMRKGGLQIQTFPIVYLFSLPRW